MVTRGDVRRLGREIRRRLCPFRRSANGLPCPTCTEPETPAEREYRRWAEQEYQR